MPEDPAARSPTPTPAPRFRPLDGLALFSKGVGMGVADIIPGVSGGTIALVSGVYERFVDALRSLSPRFLAPLATGRFKTAASEFRRMHWAVLLPLGFGVVAGVASMSRVIPTLMEDHPGATFAFFLGLILASAWVPVSRMTTRRPAHLFAGALAAVAAFLFVGLQPRTLSLEVARMDTNAQAAVYPAKVRRPADIEAVRAAAAEALGGAPARIVLYDPLRLASRTDPAGAEVIAFEDRDEMAAWLAAAPPLIVLREARAPHWGIFLAGVVAISAMILPGISGSFLLLFLGQYQAVLGAIRGVVERGLRLLGADVGPAAALLEDGWLRDALFLGAFVIGVGVGLVLVSRVVSWLLRARHDVTMAALTGLMLGALRQPAMEVVDASRVAARGGDYWLPVVGAAVAGAVLVTLLNALDIWLRARRADRT